MNDNNIRAAALRYKAQKDVKEDGKNAVLRVELSLSDDRGNGEFRFSLTAYCETPRGRMLYGGACHGEILRHFSNLAPFARLHLCDTEGAPLYAVENGFYMLHHEEYANTVCDYLRITTCEANRLRMYSTKELFAHGLERMGIIKRWADEARAAIEKLENLTGCYFKDPYKNAND